MSLLSLTSNLGLLGFALASVFYLLTFQKGQYQETLGKAAFALFAFATACTSISLAQLGREAGLANLTGLMLTSAIGWLAIGGHLQFSMRMIGAFVAPLATLILLIQFFVTPSGTAVPEGSASTILRSAHIALAVVGMAFGIIACAVSILFLWQQNLLKKKLLDQLPRTIPAIDKLDRHLTITLWAGFVFITLGLLTGAVYTQVYDLGPELHLEFKVLWAIVVWLWYLLILLAKNVFNRPGKRVAQMSLAGFALLAVTYFGMGV